MPLSVGDVVDGRFRVLRPIGAGGMGAVFVARNENTKGEVALKVLNEGGDIREEAKQRFLQEAIACARIRHPNVVGVHDSGLWEERPFIVMELLEGSSLGERVEQKALSVDEALDAMRQAANGLAAAHAAGIVHRDLKPDNLFLAQTPGQDRPVVKVLDFGIAKLSAAASLVQTASAQVFGTPSYMSPEQARGSKHVDERTDVYALGATFHEALSGKPPFAGENYNQVMIAILTQPRVPLTAVPAGVEALIARAMAREPAERFESMNALIAAIDAVAAEPTRVEGIGPAPAALPPTIASTAVATPGAVLPPTVASVPPPAGRRWLTVVVAVVAGALLVVGVYAAMSLLGNDAPSPADELRVIASEPSVPPAPPEPPVPVVVQPEPGPVATPEPAVVESVSSMRRDRTAMRRRIATMRATSDAPMEPAMTSPAMTMTTAPEPPPTMRDPDEALVL